MNRRTYTKRERRDDGWMIPLRWVFASFKHFQTIQPLMALQYEINTREDKAFLVVRDEDVIQDG